MHRVQHKIAMHLSLDFELPANKAAEAAQKVLHLLAQEGYLHVETMEWEKDVPWEKELKPSHKTGKGGNSHSHKEEK